MRKLALVFICLTLSCARERSAPIKLSGIGGDSVRDSLLQSELPESGEVDTGFFLAGGLQQNEIPAPAHEWNKSIEREYNRFTVKDRRYIELAVARGESFYPVLEQIFDDEKLPRELLAVALIESGFRKTVRSPAGAVGLWQFMPATGRVYGLKVSKRVDQRKDVVLSTLAAANHLRDLYQAFKDWKLVLAAYNAGPAAVDRAINRYKTRDYWELARLGQFPRETRRYVPRFFAAAKILSDLSAEGFEEEHRTLQMARLRGLQPLNAEKS